MPGWLLRAGPPVGSIDEDSVDELAAPGSGSPTDRPGRRSTLRRRVELVVLLAVGLVLVTAVVADVLQAAQYADRPSSDRRAFGEWIDAHADGRARWTAIQPTATAPRLDTVCGVHRPTGRRAGDVHLCLEIAWASNGLSPPVVVGGYRYRGGRTGDRRATRFGCFGSARRDHRCPPTAGVRTPASRRSAG